MRASKPLTTQFQEDAQEHTYLNFCFKSVQR